MTWSQLFMLPSALLALSACIVPALADQLIAERIDSRDTIPAPYTFPADENWDGIDGNWSTFTLQVGTPSQYVRTLLSWQSYQTWTVIPQGCIGATDYSQCASSRGGIFLYNESSTWDQVGIYSLAIETNLGFNSNAIYGFEKVTLAGNGEGGPTLKNTTVAGMARDDFYLGVFGVNPKPTNYSSLSDNSPSYMTQLKEQSLIPSVSFGFTAGAHYRFASGVYASLTLGGYDDSKFTANNITFNFGADNDHQTIVALQSITTPSNVSSSPNQVSLLSTPIYIEIDTTISQIWLPIAACLAFEAEFGLVYDNATELYLINNTQHDALLSRNANITFTIGQLTSGSQTLQIVLPYAAFDQTAKAGYSGLTTDTRYFPLKRGQNSTQYILGRTFMQEAYIIVDYEVQRFQLAQTLWNSQATEHIVAIPGANVSQSSSTWTSSTYQPNYSAPTSTTSTTNHSGLSTGAIVGIIVAIVIVILIAAAVIIFFVIRRRRRRRTVGKIADMDFPKDKDDGDHSHVFPKAELAGSNPSDFALSQYDIDRKALLSSHPPSSAGTGYSPGYTPGGEGTMSSQHSGGWPHSPMTAVSEAHSRAIYEMPGDLPERLKDGRELSEKEALQHRERKYNGIDEAMDSPSSSNAAADATAREVRRVAPENVVNAQTGDPLGRPRAFSFEFDSPARETRTDDSGRTLVHGDEIELEQRHEQRAEPREGFI